MLRLIAFGVLLIAVFAGLASWNLHRQTEMTRALHCQTVSERFSQGGTTSYDDLEPFAQEMVDDFDCDVPER